MLETVLKTVEFEERIALLGTAVSPSAPPPFIPTVPRVLHLFLPSLSEGIVQMGVYRER